MSSPGTPLATALGDWRQGHRSAALLFVPAWGTYLVIIVIASITGRDRCVSRSGPLAA